MKTCIACGMPLIKPEDFGCNDITKSTCIHCTNDDGSVKSCDEIFNGGVEFFVGLSGSDRNLAERLVRRNMQQLPQWQGKEYSILKGPIATDEEWNLIMSKLG